MLNHGTKVISVATSNGVFANFPTSALNEAKFYTVEQLAAMKKGASLVRDAAKIQDMFAEKDKVKVVIDDDMVIAQTIEVPEGKTLELDLGGKTLSSDNRVIDVTGGNVVLSNGNIESKTRPIVVFNGTLTLDGAEVTSKNDVGINATGANSKIVMNSGKVVAQESGLLITTGAKLELNGGEIECWDNCPIQGNGTVKPGNDQGHTEIVMNGGKLVAHIQSPTYTACAIYLPNSGKFIMNGGEVISEGAGLVMRAGEAELNGGSITATGASGVRGKVGDSRVVVGPYAVVYDETAKYPGVANGPFKLTIGKDMVLTGTDGDIETLLSEGAVANIVDNR